MENEVEKQPEKRKRAELNITFYNQGSVFGISIRTGHLTSTLSHRSKIDFLSEIERLATSQDYRGTLDSGVV